MILHLILDEKITKRTISLFEEAIPGENLFIVHLYPTSKINKEYPSFVYQLYENDGLESIDFSCVDRLIIHGLWMPLYKRFLKLPVEFTKVKVYWSVWGGDMYDDIIAHLGYKMYEEPFYERSLKEKILHVVKKNDINAKLNLLRSRIDTIITGREEWNLQNKYLGNILAQKDAIFPTSIYYSLEDILGSQLMNQEVYGNNILVCNSAAVTNNHNYAFKYLKKLNIGNRALYMPFSYGGHPAYKKHIKNIGNKYWGKSLIVIEDFLPLDEYNKLLLKSGICIFSSWRQQAVGNIVIALFLGAKVFLSKKNPTFTEYKKKGIVLYAVEEIDQNMLDTPLTPEQKQTNKELLYDMLCHDRIIGEIRKYFINK